MTCCSTPSAANRSPATPIAPSGIVTISRPFDGAHFFVVEPDGAQLAALPELHPEIDSVFALDDFEAAFDRLEQRGKHGKVVLHVD